MLRFLARSFWTISRFTFSNNRASTTKNYLFSIHFINFKFIIEIRNDCASLMSKYLTFFYKNFKYIWDLTSNAPALVCGQRWCHGLTQWTMIRVTFFPNFNTLLSCFYTLTKIFPEIIWLWNDTEFNVAFNIWMLFSEGYFSCR